MKNINFGIFRPEEIHMFSVRFLPLVEPVIKDEPLLSALYPRLQARVSDISVALGLTRTSKFTAQLTEADEKRDQLFLGLKSLVSGFIFHQDPAISQAARALDLMIQNRGATLYNYGYSDESSQLNGLLDDLKSPAAQQAIAAINVGYWTNALEKAQHEFEAIYKQKLETEAIQDLPRITASRREIIHLLNRMMEYVDAHAEINSEKFQPIVEKIDELIVDMRTVARTRKTKKEDNKENQPQ